MSNRSAKSKLVVTTAGTRRFIEVPSGQAESLTTYLRSSGVWASPPEPGYSGMDIIELGKLADPKAVQALLDRWM
jgi:hypothetical protein